MRYSIIAALFILVTLPVSSSSAWAQICVQLDLTKDTLPKVEQHSSVIALAEAFRAEGLEVAEAPCSDLYQVYHREFGDSVVVGISGPMGTRMTQVGSLEGIPDAYAQIVRALVQGTSLSPDPAFAETTKPNDAPDPTDDEPEFQTPTNSITADWSLFQITALRYGRLMGNERTELHLGAGAAPITGCAIQSPKCESGLAIKTGVRQYLSATRTALFLGGNLHYLHEGIRYVQQRTVMAELSAGLIRRSYDRRFHLGLGVQLFLHDEESEGLDISSAGGLYVELGRSF